MTNDRIKEIKEVVEALNKEKEIKANEELAQREFDGKMEFSEWFFYHWQKEEGLINQKTVANILANSNDRKLLCRQENAWKKR
jgi:hypothetical protein